MGALKTEFLAKSRVAALVVVLPLLLLGCSSGPPVEMRRLTDEGHIPGQTVLAENPRYLIGPGDLLHISFLGEETLSSNLRVTPDGYMSVPVLADPILASGMLIEDLREEIQKNLAQYLINPQVFLHMLELGSQHVFVLGNVRNPQLATAEPLTLVSVIAKCGGITRDGQRHQIIVMRRVPGEEPIVFDVDFMELLRGNSLVPDIPLQRFDIVIVPKSRVASARDFMMAAFGNNYVMTRFGIDAIILQKSLREQLDILYSTGTSGG